MKIFLTKFLKVKILSSNKNLIDKASFKNITFQNAVDEGLSTIFFEDCSGLDIDGLTIRNYTASESVVFPFFYLNNKCKLIKFSFH